MTRLPVSLPFFSDGANHKDHRNHSANRGKEPESGLSMANSAERCAE